MYSIIVESQFSAGHHLRLADGTREKLHEHDWQVKVQVSAQQLNEIGLVMDFIKLKAIIKEVLEPLAGGLLDDREFFQQYNSSAEYVAQYIYEKLENRIEPRANLDWVSVMEEVGCWAKYSK